MHKSAFSFLPTGENREGAHGGWRQPLPAVRGTAAAMARGKRRGFPRNRFPPFIWAMAVCGGGATAAGGGSRGGGAARFGGGWG